MLLLLALGSLPLPGFAGPLLVYPALGFVPGFLLAAWILPRESWGLRAALAIALAPLATTGIAWAVVAAGGSLHTAALVVFGVAGAGALERLLRAKPSKSDETPSLPRSVMGWAIGLTIVVIAVHLINPFVPVRGDGWTHGSIVTEIAARGIPPEDPRMAGVRLNYVWFFNFFIALLASVHGQDPFRFMSLFDAANAFATVVLVASMARRLGGPLAAHAAAALLVVGFNAGAFLLWPLRLVKAMTGEVRGMAEVSRQFANIGWGNATIIYDLSAPFALMVNFLDKFLLGTAINFAYLEMTLFFYALLLWFERGSRAALALIALSCAGMMLFHSVVGLSVIPTALAALALLALLRTRIGWLPSFGALAAATGATAFGALLTYPYVRSITAGWDPRASGIHHSFLSPEPPMAWTLLTACGIPLLFSVPAVRRGFRERRAPVLVLASLLAALLGFSLIVNLPEHNSAKFVFECFVPAVVLAAAGFGSWFAAIWRERRGLALAIGFVFAFPIVLTVQGYLADRTANWVDAMRPRSGEPELFRWIRESTPREAVFVDRAYRDVIMVRASRRLYLGTDQEPEKAAFPVDEMMRRRRVMAELYGDFATPDSTVRGLELPGRPIYVVFRPEPTDSMPDRWRQFLASAPGAEVVYDRDGYHVVRLASGGGS